MNQYQEASKLVLRLEELVLFLMPKPINKPKSPPILKAVNQIFQVQINPVFHLF
jgi:hypothetical protein